MNNSFLKFHVIHEVCRNTPLLTFSPVYYKAVLKGWETRIVRKYSKCEEDAVESYMFQQSLIEMRISGVCLRTTSVAPAVM